MNPSDVLRSHIRTWVPIGVGFLATILVDWVARKFGIRIEGELAYSMLYAGTTAAVYSLGRWLETRRWAPARGMGRMLLSLGLNVGQPVYKPTAAPPTPVSRVRRPDPRRNL